ncbi:hypothetical protein HPP92_020617 [Vanilla planifolia]|uniref:NAC domain-containing protein n=1 Tax=Vanilla planifolia TaxID=51239 RepID=A0A835PX79_VANPL|nr:hypothetical protein HPP92_020617 [Vanilla planifolia]
MERTGTEPVLPGFRFHPTEEELLEFYLRRTAAGRKLHIDIIGTLNLYLYEPWDLPRLAKLGEREWYFFVPRDRRQAYGGRPNRTTERGFWKATGADRPVRSTNDPRKLVGLKKTLVYYHGRAPRGAKTDWVMSEYRLPETSEPSSTGHREEIVLCKVYRKATSMKELEQRAAMEEDGKALISAQKRMDSAEIEPPSAQERVMSAAIPPFEKLPEITACRKPPNLQAIQVQVPVPSPGLGPAQPNFDWSADPFMNTLYSPWHQWSPLVNF